MRSTKVWTGTDLALTLAVALALALALTLVLVVEPASARTEAGGIEGFWKGAIDAGSSSIDVEVLLSSESEGGLSGAISFPAQGDYDVALKLLELSAESVRFTIPEVPGEPIFDGSLGSGGERLSGTFSQHGRSYPFELSRAEASRPLAAVGVAARSALVEAIAERLIEGYIYEDAGKRIAEGLRASQASGKLGEGLTAPALAQALTEELGSLSDDIHLRVEYRGSTSDPLAARGHGGRSSEPAEAAEAVESSKPSEPSQEAHGPGSTGIGGHQIFEENIGYLNMVHFGGGDQAAAELDKVMAELADVRALIIDLRENLGGGPFMVRYLSTYLFDEPTHLASRVGRDLPEPEERWTFESTRGKRLADVPVVLLISNKTVSAGESFAFGLRNSDRATIIGERTAGGGHFGDMVDLGDGFSMFLPVGKTVNPKTGKGWEAEGLEPDVEIEAEFALEAVVDRLNSQK